MDEVAVRQSRPRMQRELRAAPLGPESLTWKWFGDTRLFFMIGRTGTMQNMLPAVGAALQTEHSNFFDNPADRLLRSLPPINGVIYDPVSERTGAMVRDFHRDIKGVDHHGQRYHALNPDVFWWTHATFVEVVIAVAENFGEPLSADEKDQVVREGVTWWRRYGLTDSPVIDNYADFTAYWDRMLAEELENNATTQFAVSAPAREMPAPPNVPAAAWVVLRGPALAFNRWLMRALLPQQCREILGVTWSARDQRRFQRFTTVVRLIWPRLPMRLRYQQRARIRIQEASAEDRLPQVGPRE